MIHFTVAEAEALLPRLREALLEMQRCKREIDVLRTQLVEKTESASGNGHVKDETALREQRRRAEALVERMNEVLADVNELGVEVKDVDQGLLDFPHERDGRVVYLCWRMGEAGITWWHEIDSGFAGRQPL
jgi:hypothetical protein